MSCLLCLFFSPSRTVLHKRCLNKQMRTKGWGDRGPERIRTGQQLEDALGTGSLYTTLYCTMRAFLFRENRSQHGAIGHVGISHMSFRKGYIFVKLRWVLTALKMMFIKIFFPSPLHLIFSKLANSFMQPTARYLMMLPKWWSISVHRVNLLEEVFVQPIYGEQNGRTHSCLTSEKCSSNLVCVKTVQVDVSLMVLIICLVRVPWAWSYHQEFYSWKR